MTLMQFTVFSDVLQMDMPVWALVPDRPQEDDAPWRVLWLLHGGSGDQTNWLRSTRVEEYASEYKNLAVIMPHAYQSCFINMARGQKYGEYIGRELVEKMRALLPRLSRRREDNWIAGFSNGGYGCLMVGLTYPETFGVIGAYGAGDKADADFGYRNADKERLFGPGDMKDGPYSARKKIRELPLSGRPIPEVEHGVGEFDNWRDMNEMVRDEFLAVPGDPYKYHYAMYAGEKHSSRAMDIAIRQFFERFA